MERVDTCGLTVFMYINKKLTVIFLSLQNITHIHPLKASALLFVSRSDFTREIIFFVQAFSVSHSITNKFYIELKMQQ